MEVNLIGLLHRTAGASWDHPVGYISRILSVSLRGLATAMIGVQDSHCNVLIG